MLVGLTCVTGTCLARASGLGLAGHGCYPVEQGSGGPTHTTERLREDCFPEVKQDGLTRRGEVCADPSDYVNGVAFRGNNKTSPQRFQQKGLFTSLTRIPGLKQQLQDGFRLFLPLALKSVACRPLSPSLSYHGSPRTAQAPGLVFLLQVGRRGQSQKA